MAGTRPKSVWTTSESIHQNYKYVGVPSTRVLGHSGAVPKKNLVPGRMRRETLEIAKEPGSWGAGYWKSGNTEGMKKRHGRP